jgi:hypothetical protein
MKFFLEHIDNVDFKYIIWNNNSAFCDLDLLNNKILKNNRKTKINNLYHD